MTVTKQTRVGLIPISMICAASLILIVLPPATISAETFAMYGDDLAPDWQDWSWAAANLEPTSPVHGGSHSASVAYTDGGQGVQLYRPLPAQASCDSMSTAAVPASSNIRCNSCGRAIVAASSLDIIRAESVFLFPRGPMTWRGMVVAFDATVPIGPPSSAITVNTTESGVNTFIPSTLTLTRRVRSA